jgi:hypothetical protein
MRGTGEPFWRSSTICTVHNSIRQDPEVGIRMEIHSLAA